MVGPTKNAYNNDFKIMGVLETADLSAFIKGQSRLSSDDDNSDCRRRCRHVRRARK